MSMIYYNNDVKITSERQNQHESKININGENLIWISKEDEEEFKKALSNVLDSYRI